MRSYLVVQAETTNKWKQKQHLTAQVQKQEACQCKSLVLQMFQGKYPYSEVCNWKNDLIFLHCCLKQTSLLLASSRSFMHHIVHLPKKSRWKPKCAKTYIFQEQMHYTSKLCVVGLGASAGVEEEERKKGQEEVCWVQRHGNKKQEPWKTHPQRFCNCTCALVKSPVSEDSDLRPDRNLLICILTLGLPVVTVSICISGSTQQKGHTYSSHVINWWIPSELWIPKKKTDYVTFWNMM